MAILFLLAAVFLAAGGQMGHKIMSGPPSLRPIRPGPMMIVTGVAAVASAAWLIYGFFPFSWWLPLLAFPFFSIAWIVISPALSKGNAPFYAMGYSVVGIVIATYVVIRVHASGS